MTVQDIEQLFVEGKFPRPPLRDACRKLGMNPGKAVTGSIPELGEYLLEHATKAEPAKIEAAKAVLGDYYSLFEEAFEAKKASKTVTAEEPAKRRGRPPKSETAAAKTEIVTEAEGTDVRLDVLEKKISQILGGVEVVNDRLDAATQRLDVLEKLLMFVVTQFESDYTDPEAVPDVRENDSGE